MSELKSGIKGDANMEVTRQYCTSRGGGPWVFSTPSMLLFCERSCNDMTMPFLKPGQAMVGVSATIKHLAPTPEGMSVRAEMEIIEVERRRVRYSVKIFDEMELCGECEHERFVIDLDKAGERIGKKIAAMKR